MEVLLVLLMALQRPLKILYRVSPDIYQINGKEENQLLFFVKEKRIPVESKLKIDIHIKQFPKTYWKYLIVVALFGIGNSSNAFLILQIKDKGLSLINTVFVYAMFNLAAAIISYPAGSLSDKFGRKPLL